MNFLISLLVLIFSSANALDLYEQGDIAGARAAFAADLQRALQGEDLRAQWQAYMALAWFQDELSEHRDAIENSNKALALAKKLNDPFMLGRSLCWLGWAYAGLGMYEAALAFYTNAVEIGAPQGNITYVHVWGLATQEIGAIKFKMGETKEARKLLETTYVYAKEHGIDAGVSEGGAHLAEIALAEGAYDDAEKYAQAAIEAAESCKCSMYNLTQAKLVAAKARLERTRFDPTKLPAVSESLESLLNECEKLEHVRCIAETKLLMSKIVPAGDFNRRYELVQSAFESLANAESELRGAAEAEMGRVFLENQNAALAEFYLKNGLKVDKEMLRKVDRTYMKSSLADASGMLQKDKDQLERLIQAQTAAKKTNALPALLEADDKLADLFLAKGYKSAAYSELRDSLVAVNTLLAENPFASPEHKHFEQTRLELYEKLVSLGVELQREEAPEP